MGLRARRLGDEIRDVLAEALLGNRIGDPRLEGVSITYVRLTDDLQIAYIYFRTYDGGAPEAALEALADNTGALRKRVAKAIRLRRVPELRFNYDVSVDEGRKIEALLDQIHHTETEKDDSE